MNKDEELTKIDLESRKWKNRRYITYGFCFFIFVLTILVFFAIPLSTVTALQSIITMIYTGSFSIIGAYFGFSTWADIKKNV